MTIAEEVHAAVLQIERGAITREINMVQAQENHFECIRNECETAYNRLITQYPDDVSKATIEYCLVVDITNYFGDFQDSEITRFVAETLPFLRD